MSEGCCCTQHPFGLLSGQMSSYADPVTENEPTRRHLSSRQADTVNRLVEAAVDQVRAAGFAGLTIRNVAARAGVAPATAYTYFASKEHLVSEVFWRRLRALPPSSIDGRLSAPGRVGVVLRDVAMLVADEPELSAACTAALLVDDADVRRIRDRIGIDIHQRLAAALTGKSGRPVDPVVLRSLELAYSGAMVQTGTGHISYSELGDRLTEVAELICQGLR